MSGMESPRRVGRRDRRGRGLRGPLLLPRPGRPAPHRRNSFDELALRVIMSVDLRWRDRLGPVEYAVEDVPDLPRTWVDPIPLAAVTRTGRTHRLVVFRRPVEHRARTRADQEALLLAVVIEQFAEMLGIPPEDVDPRYEAE